MRLSLILGLAVLVFVMLAITHRDRAPLTSTFQEERLRR